MAILSRSDHSFAGSHSTGRSLAVAIVAAELAIMFVGATLPTPLYPLYRTAFGFGGVTLTLIYAVYVLGNLIALLIFGRLSDQIGRRLTTYPAIGIGIISVLVFIAAQGTSALFVARVLSGFATGLASGTATAWLAELLPKNDDGASAQTACAANFSGLAVGPLIAGILAQLAPWPLRLPYAVYLVILIAIGFAVAWAPETVANPKQRLSDLSLRPRLGVPRDIRLQFVSPAVTAFVTFALIGFYAALIPGVLSESLDEKAPIASGSIVFALFVVAAVATLLTRRIRSAAAMLSGLGLLLPGLAVLISAEVFHSMFLLVTASVVGGIAAALGYRGSLEVVNGIAPSDRRSEVVSSYLIAVYVGNSVPVIGIGLLTAVTGSLAAHLTFAIVIALFAVAALAVGAKYSK